MRPLALCLALAGLTGPAYAHREFLPWVFHDNCRGVVTTCDPETDKPYCERAYSTLLLYDLVLAFGDSIAAWGHRVVCKVGCWKETRQSC